MPAFGRIRNHDPRSRAFPAMTVVNAVLALVVRSQVTPAQTQRKPRR